MDLSGLPLTAFILTALGWISREILRWRKAKREATKDAVETLKDKKSLLQEILSETKDIDKKSEINLQISEVNTALLGLHSERLRRTLKSAGLPSEEVLIIDGINQLQPQQINALKVELAALNTLPQTDSIENLFSVANAYYYANQFQEALQTYNRIVAIKPDDPGTLNNRGITYRQLEKYDEALADYNRSLELSPDNPSTLSNRGITYRKLQKYDESIVDHNRSLELRPDNPSTLNNRGATYNKLEKYDKALADFNRSLELRPDDPDTLNNRGVNYGQFEKYDEALADFNRSLELRPNTPATLYNIACLYSLQNKTDDALAFLEKAIEQDGNFRKMANEEEDFNNLKDVPRFKKLSEQE